MPTPAIDAVFSKGIEMTNFMGWCVCSPTRAMLLTGRHPIRGVFGKWHNGNEPETPEYRAAFAEAFQGMPNKKPSLGHGVNAHGGIFVGHCRVITPRG